MQANPEKADGRNWTRLIYSKAIDQSDIHYYRNIYKVISTQLKGGKLHIRVLSGMRRTEGWSLCRRG